MLRLGVGNVRVMGTTSVDSCAEIRVSALSVVLSIKAEFGGGARLKWNV